MQAAALQSVHIIAAHRFVPSTAACTANCAWRRLQAGEANAAAQAPVKHCGNAHGGMLQEVPQ